MRIIRKSSPRKSNSYLEFVWVFSLASLFEQPATQPGPFQKLKTAVQPLGQLEPTGLIFGSRREKVQYLFTSPDRSFRACRQVRHVWTPLVPEMWAPSCRAMAFKSPRMARFGGGEVLFVLR